jgi:hypothetical protein
MDDTTAASMAIEGLFQALSPFISVPVGVVTGIGLLGQAAAFFFGVKHERKKAAKKEDSDFIENILKGKDDAEHSE